MFKTSASLRILVSAVSFIPLSVAIAGAQVTPEASPFTYQTFTVPNAVTLNIEAINNAGTISGSYVDASGDLIGFYRTSAGTITTYTEPANTSTPSYTAGGSINNAGTIVGEFYDTAALTYEGYVYKTSTDKFTAYNVPNEPQYTTTSLSGINNSGNLCGFVFPPPYTAVSAFLEVSGTVTIFSVDSATTTECTSINDSGTSVGYYVDSAGVDHGWMRTSSGTITTIDVPGEATVTGTAPCVSSPVAGTIPLGINDSGYISGHFWDTSYNEHGFLMTPSGQFAHLNVPGAYQTSGGGLNAHAVVVGHYADSSCNNSGYIATP